METGHCDELIEFQFLAISDVFEKIQPLWGSSHCESDQFKINWQVWMAGLVVQWNQWQSSRSSSLKRWISLRRILKTKLAIKESDGLLSDKRAVQCWKSWSLWLVYMLTGMG